MAEVLRVPAARPKVEVSGHGGGWVSAYLPRELVLRAAEQARDEAASALAEMGVHLGEGGVVEGEDGGRAA
jgi:hypothetical protein